MIHSCRVLLATKLIHHSCLSNDALYCLYSLFSLFPRFLIKAILRIINCFFKKMNLITSDQRETALDTNILAGLFDFVHDISLLSVRLLI